MAAMTARPNERLLADFDAGKPAALARVVSIVENHRPGFDTILGDLHPRVGRARRIGITGPPGARARRSGGSNSSFPPSGAQESLTRPIFCS